MKRRRQGYNDRLDESLGMRHKGIHKQSFKDRRDESKGMEKSLSRRAYQGDRDMDDSYHHHMALAHHKYMANKHRKSMYKK